MVIDYFIKEGKNNIVISCPNSGLYDNWRSEISKHAYTHLTDYIQYTTHTSVSKITKTIDLLVIDEVDKSLTDKTHSNLNICHNILGLTGTLTAKKEKLALKYNVPVLSRITMEQAVEYGFINKTKFGTVYFDLSTEKNIEVKYKKGSFYVSERSQYDYFDGLFEECKEELYFMGYRSLGTNVYKYLMSERFKNEYPEHYTVMQKYSMAINGRKKVITTSQSAITSVRKIHKLISQRKLIDVPEARAIIFHERIEQLEKICKNVVHGRTGKTKKESEILNALTLERYNNKEFNVIGSCKQLVAGTNLVDTYLAYHLGFNGSERDTLQKNGRISRLDVDQIGYNLFFLPRDTIQESWLNNALNGINIDFNINL